jgi:hypothetical protein
MSRTLPVNDISEFGIMLSNWVADPKNRVTLSGCIIEAQRIYQSEYEARTNPLGKPVEHHISATVVPAGSPGESAASAPVVSAAKACESAASAPVVLAAKACESAASASADLTKSFSGQVSALASTASIFTLWAATTVATKVCETAQQVANVTMQSITSNRIADFHEVFPEVTEKNALAAFLYAGQMPGWQVAGHTGGTGRASLNSLIVDRVIRSLPRANLRRISPVVMIAYDNGDLAPRDIFIACNTAILTNPALRKAPDAQSASDASRKPELSGTTLFFSPGS